MHTHQQEWGFIIQINNDPSLGKIKSLRTTLVVLKYGTLFSEFNNVIGLSAIIMNVLMIFYRV